MTTIKRGTLSKPVKNPLGLFIANADCPILYSNIQLLLSASATVAGDHKPKALELPVHLE
jgi:hypothetical protein